MTHDEVLKRLCILSFKVQGQFDSVPAVDCFCSNGTDIRRGFGFSFDDSVIEYIEKAVEDKIEAAANAEYAEKEIAKLAAECALLRETVDIEQKNADRVVAIMNTVRLENEGLVDTVLKLSAKLDEETKCYSIGERSNEFVNTLDRRLRAESTELKDRLDNIRDDLQSLASLVAVGLGFLENEKED